MENKIKGYKGFNPDLKCKGFQYEVGKEYETEKAVSCKAGFHFCENPFDVLRYYSPSDVNGINRFCEVEGSGIFDKSEKDKVACTHIKIDAEIGLQGLVEAGIKFILDKVNWKDCKDSKTGGYSTATNTGFCSVTTNTSKFSVATNTGDCSVAANIGKNSVATNTGYRSVAINIESFSAATNGGDYSVAINTENCSVAVSRGEGSAATSTGNRSVVISMSYLSVAANTGSYSVATNTGNCSVATNTGYCSAATNEGTYSAATNTGNRSVATNTGYRSAATNTGEHSKAINMGNRSTAINMGDYSVASVEGEDSIAIVTGRGSKAKGRLGCWIVLTERGGWNGDTYPIKEVRAVKVDGEIIKEDTYYALINGEIVKQN